MQIEQLFRQASSHFQDNNYQQGLNLMTKCIQYAPTNSSLYSNRALFYSQLRNIDAAVEDLVNAINYNYLNYVAYFNLFSIQFNAGQIFPAFDNLCCSLSCLYLVRARKARRELDVQRAIKYAENNPQAHILKALMYLQDGKNKLALNQIEWALDIQVHTQLCIKIKNIINRKLNPYAVSEIFDDSFQKNGFRLHTTYEPVEGYDVQIRERVREFNEIYDEIVNSQFGTVTQKVQRIRLQNESSNVHNSKFISEISEIYEIRYKQINNNKQSRFKSSDAIDKELIARDQNESDLLMNKNEDIYFEKSEDGRRQQDNLLEDDSLDRLQQQIILNKQKQEHKIQIINQIEQYNGQDLLKQQQRQQNLLQEQNLLINDQPLQIKIKEPSPATNSTSPIVTPRNQPQSINLYPIGNKKKIKFIVISSQIKNPLKNKDFYLIGNYNSRKGQRIKTPNKKIQNNIIKWNSQIPPTFISQTPQTVSVKIFSKQYFNYNDDLIGQGQIQIIKTGQIKFPIYFKNKVTGFVSLKVDLI